MATTTFKTFFKRIAARKKNPDWARVEEPDEIIKPVLFGIVGMTIAAFSMMAAWTMMTISPMEWIASFLVSLHSDLPFEKLYATFASAVIVLVDLLIMIVFIFFGTPDNGDVIEMISDLDSNTQERIVELDNTLNEKLDAIKRNE
jgi:hypothetical protein